MNSKETTANNDNSTLLAYNDIKKELQDLTTKIDLLFKRIDTLVVLLTPARENDLADYLNETLETIIRLDHQKDGLPIKRDDLGKELGIHSNTAYIRAEKLVEKKKVQKYYGRDLGIKKAKEKKAVYYSLFKTLYNRSYLEGLEQKNEIAYRIAQTLLQKQPISKQELLKDSQTSLEEIEKGLTYLIRRGLIIQEGNENLVQYRIRKINQENNSQN